MRSENRGKKIIFSVVVLFVVGVFSLGALCAYTFPEWAHGISGYRGVLREATEGERPLILYFHSEWGTWSERMNREYLASYEVEDFLRDIPKVEINPDRGPDEKALSKKYNVTGFPAFLLTFPAFDDNEERVYPHTKDGTWAVREFIKALRNKISRKYNGKAFYSFGNGENGDALKYLNMAIEYDSENSYSYYLLGCIFHRLGSEEKDREYLKRAEKNYLKALEMNPDHRGCKGELEKLSTLMERMK